MLFGNFGYFLGGNLKIADICFGWSVRSNILGVHTRCKDRAYVYAKSQSTHPPGVKVKLAVGYELQMV